MALSGRGRTRSQCMRPGSRKGKDGAAGKAGSLVLLPRAKWHHSSQIATKDGSNGVTLRSPRLCWSSPPAPKQRRGVTRGTTHVRQAPATRVDDEVIKRLGKTCGAVIDVLDGRGTATIREIADVLQISRHRDLRRRVIARLEERGIVTVSGDEKVMLVGNWLESA